VSALVCFELFARPVLRGLMGLDVVPNLVTAKLANDFPHRSDRPTYHPAELSMGNGCLQVQPVPWFGSPDMRGVTAANAFVVLPPGDVTHQAGTTLEVLAPEHFG
jgi:molybdopterin molybdotransferase